MLASHLCLTHSSTRVVCVFLNTEQIPSAYNDCGGSCLGTGEAALNVVAKVADVENWERVHHKKAKPDKKSNKVGNRDRAPTEDEKKNGYKSALVASMLRFKNLTGANFNAAEHTDLYVEHDTMQVLDPSVVGLANVGLTEFKPKPPTEPEASESGPVPPAEGLAGSEGAADSSIE